MTNPRDTVCIPNNLMKLKRCETHYVIGIKIGNLANAARNYLLFIIYFSNTKYFLCLTNVFNISLLKLIFAVPKCQEQFLILI